MVLEQRCARTVYDEAYDAPREGRGVRRTFVAYSRAPEGLRTESLSLKDLGDVGEDLAAEYLESIGMSVVERKWRCGLGEVDIVAEDGGALVVEDPAYCASVAFDLGDWIDMIIGTK